MSAINDYGKYLFIVEYLYSTFDFDELYIDIYFDW